MLNILTRGELRFQRVGRHTWWNKIYTHSHACTHTHMHVRSHVTSWFQYKSPVYLLIKVTAVRVILVGTTALCCLEGKEAFLP